MSELQAYLVVVAFGTAASLAIRFVWMGMSAMLHFREMNARPEDEYPVSKKENRQ